MTLHWRYHHTCRGWHTSHLDRVRCDQRTHANTNPQPDGHSRDTRSGGDQPHDTAAQGDTPIAVQGEQ